MALRFILLILVVGFAFAPSIASLESVITNTHVIFKIVFALLMAILAVTCLANVGDLVLRRLPRWLAITNFVLAALTFIVVYAVFPLDIFSEQVLDSWWSNPAYAWAELVFNVQPYSPIHGQYSRIGLVCLLGGIYSLTFFLFPLLQGYGSDIRKVASWAAGLNLTSSKRVFSIGADFLDKGSKWALLFALVVYIAYDRERLERDSAINSLLAAQTLGISFGKKSAIETLARQGESFIGMNANDSDLSRIRIHDGALGPLSGPPTSFADADFVKAKLVAADFACGIFHDADFSQADLRDAVFLAADLRRATFVGTNFGSSRALIFTDFSHSDLRGAMFTDAKGPGIKVLAAIGRRNRKEIQAAMESESRLDELQQGAALLLGADLRQAQLGKDVVGMRLLRSAILVEAFSLTPPFSNSDWKFFKDFPVLNVLSAGSWDSSTKFPIELEIFLEEYNLRNGPRIESKVLASAREAMQRYIDSQPRSRRRAHQGVAGELDSVPNVGRLLGIKLIPPPSHRSLCVTASNLRPIPEIFPNQSRFGPFNYERHASLESWGH